MAHPFFSVVRYPLQLPLARELRDKLAQCYDAADRARQLAEAAGIEPARIAWEKPVRDVWYELLNEATKSRSLERLLREIALDGRARAIHDVVQRVLASDDIEGVLATVDTLLLPGDQPFLDRTTLRALLRQLAPRTTVAPSVLLVRGEPGTGKTTTRILIMQLAEGLGDPVIYFDEGNAREVGKVALKILRKLDPGRGAGTDPHTTPDAWYQTIWEEALERATAANRRLWLIVDDIGSDTPGGEASIDRDVLSFFHRLAELLTRYPDEYAASFRLVLLDYAKASNRPPTKVNRDLLREDDTEPLSADHVAAFVETFWRSRNKEFSKADLEAETARRLEEVKARQDAGAGECHARVLRDVLFRWVTRPQP